MAVRFDLAGVKLAVYNADPRTNLKLEINPAPDPPVSKPSPMT